MKIPHKNPSFIELYGMFGEFKVPNSKYIIKYFSTFANNREDGSDYHKFLKELKPMRERTNPEKIDDLGSLLQRDLSDFRVAKELVPYLLNTMNKNSDEKHIAFFPAILCVMMPSDFIDGGEKANYPKPSTTDTNSGNISYNREWECEYFPDDSGVTTSLGKLKIDLGKTQIIVLDGQHRANAFRLIANSFDVTGRNSIYSNFYSDIEIPKKLEADLPVTVVWFESIESEFQIQPDLISRRLFVDVNQSAKNINQSRFVLLNDREPSSILTRFFYSFLAKNFHFECNNFSLIHSGFDFDENLRSRVSPHKLTLTVPEMLSYAYDWLFFGRRTYNALNYYRVGAERERKELDNFDFYFGAGSNAKYIELYTDLDENVKKGVKGNIDLLEFENDFIDSFGSNFYKLFTSFPMVKSHIEASNILQQDRNEMVGKDWSSPTMQDTWDRLFKGGEGLYYVFNRIKDKKAKGKELSNAAYRIEEIFSLERKKIILKHDTETVDKAFDTFRTIAFQVGYIMAFDKFYRDSDFVDLNEGVESFVNRINELSVNEWVVVLTSLKDALVKDVDPKLWPTYKNLILRIIQNKNEFYDNSTYHFCAPESLIIKNSFLNKCKNYTVDNLRRQLKETYLHEIPEENILTYIAAAIRELNDLFGLVKGLKPLEIDFSTLCRAELQINCLKEEQE
jgi:hypothetical protein